MATVKRTVEGKAFPRVRHKSIFTLLPTKWGMLDHKKLQLLGPIGVIAALACAECGARALAYWPSSSLLWCIDLEIFRPLQYSLAAANERFAIGDLTQTLWVAAPLLACMCIGLLTGRRFPLALASNLSFVYSAALLYGSYLADQPAAASLHQLSALWAPSFFLALSVLLAAFVSTAASHRTYWRAIFS